MIFHGGLDWGAVAHAVCIVDDAGQVITRLEVSHDAAGLRELSRASGASLPRHNCRSPSSDRPG